MKVYLLPVDGAARMRCVQPYEGSAYVDVVDTLCPVCNKALAVAGTSMHPSQDDRAWESDAYSTCCKEYIGELRVEMNTLFGVREDAAVLSGRCRVY
jgi:hypothetical protein